MGRVERDQLWQSDLKCWFCGDSTPATGYWSHRAEDATSAIGCCPDCAIGVLPKLLADAIWRRTDDASELRRKWALAEKEFWYAVSFASREALRSKAPATTAEEA